MRLRVPAFPVGVARAHSLRTHVRIWSVGFEAERRLVAAHRELNERFDEKIQATIARIWGEEKREVE